MATTSAEIASAMTRCPQCGSAIPSHPHYVTWCMACNWNVHPSAPEEPRRGFARVYQDVGRRASQALYDQLAKASSLRPRITRSKLLASAIAALVHMISLSILLFGVVLAVRGWPNPFAVGLALLCIGVSWVTRVRLGRTPTNIAPRDQFPTLYKVADAIAHELNTRPVAGIVINGDFNASYQIVSWRRQPIVTLGLPLMALLNPQQQVALLAHELAHGVNGDSSRSFVVGSAIDTLRVWSYVIRPQRILYEEEGLAGLVMVPLNLLLLGVAQLVDLCAATLTLLLWRDSQRAEYLADYLAARIGGSAAACALLETLLLGPSFKMTVRRIVHSRRQDQMFAALREEMASVPAHERERLGRVEALDQTRLDVTHPPTMFRIRFLQARDAQTPHIVLSADEIDQLDRELASCEAEIRGGLASSCFRS
jgi:Zn-dependent protease with chaperone function